MRRRTSETYIASGDLPAPDPDKVRREQERGARALELFGQAQALRNKATTPEEIRRAQAMLEEIPRLFTESENTALTISVPDAINPRFEAYKDSGITGPESEERLLEVVNFAELLRSDKEYYASIGLTKWASALPDTLSLSQEQHDRFKELIQQGNIPLFLPDRQTQLDTIDTAIEKLKPVWYEGGAEKPVNATAHTWDHFKKLTGNKNPALVIGVPDRPYISFTQPTQSPPEETKNKKVVDQITLFQTRKATNPRLHVMNPPAYLLLQDRHTRRVLEHATVKHLALTTLTPLDKDTWTRFLDLPLSADGCVPGGGFWAGNAQLRLGRSSAGVAGPRGGFRFEVREEI